MPGSLNLFNLPITNIAYEKPYTREYLTLNPVEESPFQIKILTGQGFMRGPRNRIHIDMEILKKDKGKTDFVVTKAADNISVIDAIGALWIEDMKISFNQQEVFNGNGHYAYKAFFEMMLHYAEESKKSSMNAYGMYYDDQGKGVYNDDVEEMKKVYADLITHKSFQEKRDLFTDGKKVQFTAPFFADVFMMDNLILNNLDIDIHIEPHKTKFLVFAPNYEGEVKLKFSNLRVECGYVDLHPGIVMDLEKKLESEPAKYPMRRTILKDTYYDKSRTEAHTSLYSDFIPRELYIGFIKKEHWNGTQETDPFNFQHFNIRNIQIRAGNILVPSVQFENDFPAGKYIRAFDHLHTTMAVSGSNVDCGINRKMFAAGWTIFPFNLTTSQEDDDTFDFVRDGQTQMDIRWNKNIPEGGITCIIMGQWDSIMYIDRTRTVRTDLTI